jgi:hypothetical protein
MIKRRFYKDLYCNHIIIRRWWKLKEYEELEVTLPTRYMDCWEEKEFHKSCMLVLKDWVLDDIREQLIEKVKKIKNEIKRSKRLLVSFYTEDTDRLNKIEFYLINGKIYLEDDNTIRRNKILEKLLK